MDRRRVGGNGMRGWEREGQNSRKRTNGAMFVSGEKLRNENPLETELAKKNRYWQNNNNSRSVNGIITMGTRTALGLDVT